MEKFTAGIRIRDIFLQIQKYRTLMKQCTHNLNSRWWFEQAIENMNNRIKELQKIAQ